MGIALNPSCRGAGILCCLIVWSNKLHLCRRSKRDDGKGLISMGRASLATTGMCVASLVILQFTLAVCADDGRTGAKAGKPPRPAEARSVRICGEVRNDAGTPIAGARIRVAVPAADMRFVTESTGQKLFETTTDEKGQYALYLGDIGKPTKVSIDAMFAGYERLCGTLAAGGDAREVEVAPGRVSDANLKLSRPCALFCRRGR